LRYSLTRHLPYDAGDLFTLVGDVETYPEFVRWITALRTWNRRSEGEGVTLLDAEARVKFAVLRERFATRVRLDRPNLTIDVSLISGPFRRLENHWRFQPAADGASLRFDIAFEFRSPLLAGLLAANFGKAAETLVNCFEVRAAELYGEKRWTGNTGC
jgi:coenzyme Q-binding protein COQ10